MFFLTELIAVFITVFVTVLVVMTTEGKRCPDLGHAKDDSSFRLQFLKGLDKALLELEAVGNDQPGLRNSGQLC